MVKTRKIRPGNVIAQCLAKAQGKFVHRQTIYDYMEANLIKYQQKSKNNIDAHIRDIRKYDHGHIEKNGPDEFRLVNSHLFDFKGQNPTAAWTIRIKARNRGGLYMIKNRINGYIYVGQTMNFGRRRAIHRNKLRKGAEHHCGLLKLHWNEPGAAADGAGPYGTTTFMAPV